MAHIEMLIIANPQDGNWTIVDVALSAKTLRTGTNPEVENSFRQFQMIAKQQGEVTEKIGFGECDNRAYTQFRAKNTIGQELEVRMFLD